MKKTNIKQKQNKNKNKQKQTKTNKKPICQIVSKIKS
jgi:hypothetical protein